MKFCTHCGSRAISRAITTQGVGVRYLCAACGQTHYCNPRVVVGCLGTWEERVVLCRRNIEPCRGLWTFPAGYLEIGESLEEAASREAREEAGAEFRDFRLFALYDLPQIGELYVLYLASLVDPGLRPGPETSEVGLFDAGDIPWHALAFTMVREALTAWTMMNRTKSSPVFTADFRHVALGALGVRQRRQQT